MDLKQVQYFLAICKNKSFSKAAEEIYISQQGLSLSMSRLESELDCKLFYRQAKGVALTPQGECFYAKAQEMLHLYNDIIQSISKETTTLKIASTFASSLITSKVFDSFKLKNEQIQLSISEFSDKQCESAVEKGTYDIGLCSGPLLEGKFESRLLVSEPVRAVVNINHQLASKESITINDLRFDNILIMNQYFNSHSKFLSRCQNQGFSPKINLETGDMYSLFKGVKTNQGICITNRYVAEYFKTDEMLILPFEDPSYTWDLHIFWNKDKVLSSVNEKLVDFLVKNI